MKLFTVYEAGTGTIRRTGYCQDETLALQPMNDSEAVAEGHGDPSSQFVDPATGALVSLPNPNLSGG